MKNLPFFLLFLISLVSCKGSNVPVFTIEGTLKGMPKTTIFLEEMSLSNEQKLLDSTKSLPDGSFTLEVPLNKNQAIYRIRMANKSLLIVNDEAKVKIIGNWQSLPKLEKNVSPGTSSLNALLDRIYQQEENLAAAQLALDTLHKNRTSDSLLADFEQKVTLETSAFNDYLKKYADTTKYLPVAILAAMRIDEPSIQESIHNKLSKRFGNQDMVAQYAAFLKNNAPSATVSKTVVVGASAPDFTLSTAEGKRLSMSSLRGKYVLLDFWASWCAPCRKENPSLVAAYRTFREQNFEILGVSLDDNKEKWLQAIAADRILWPQVSDYQGWNSAVVELYGVAALPSNFLIDPSGKVIATNLRGDALVDKLNEIFKK